MLCNISLPDGVSFLRDEACTAAGEGDLILRFERSPCGEVLGLALRGDDAASCSKGLTYVNIPAFCVASAFGDTIGSKGVGVEFSLLPKNRIGDSFRPETLLLASVIDGCWPSNEVDARPSEIWSVFVSVLPESFCWGPSPRAVVWFRSLSKAS